MKVFLLLFVLMISMAAAAQRGWTDGFSPRANQSYVVEDGNLSARNQFFTPRYDDTTDANDNILDDTLGQVIYTYHPHAFWGRVYSGGNIWIQIPMTPYTASEGVSLSGSDFQWLGPLATPSNMTTQRSVNLRGQQLYFNNRENVTTSGGPIWQHSDRPFSPYQLLSIDTLTANDIDPPTDVMPLSGLFARRTMYYADNILRTQKIYGHYIGQTFDWKDSMQFKTEGGDYNQAVTAELSLNPRGTGKQVAMSGISAGQSITPYYSEVGLLANVILRNTPTNYIYVRGGLVGVASYLVAGTNAADTVERFAFFQTNNFLANSSRVKKYFGIDFQHNLATSSVDSSWGVWDQYGYRHWLRGSTVVGNAYDSSVTGYSFKVNGTMYMRGLFQGFQGTDVASTAGVMTLPGSGTAGNIYEITGTNTITAINNTNLKNGYEVTLVFTSTATLTDGTANSGAAIGMELEGNTNFVATADDTVTLVLCELGGLQRWRMKGKSVN